MMIPGNMNSLTAKIFGCIVGGAIGNAMGSIVENWTFDRIEKIYGKIEMPLDLKRIESEDDHQIAMLFTDAYLEYRRNITPEDLAEVWKSKFKHADRFFWCLRNALELLKRGVSPRQTGLYNINTGSAIMAIAPVGIFNMLEPDRAFSDALDLAFMYQPEPDAFCAAAMASGYAMAFKKSPSVDEICKTILNHSLNKDIKFWDDRKVCNIHESVKIGLEIADKYGTDWWSARKEIQDRLGQWHPIEPIEVLSITTCLFKMTGGNYVEGLIAGTNIGRDSDTISNLIGGLCGAMHGYKCIPEDWMEGVQEINPSLMDRFIRVANDFSALINHKIKNYKSIADEIARLINE
ncbi:MAG: ADP-ribosylglycohydrolase family protein [Candidatus Helarchaeales archaeon]